MQDEELDITKLRYVLYARKSTTDESRQVRSIGDQIKECLQMARNKGLTVIGSPIAEEKSAKTPNQRPKFNQMLKDIQAGKYDGILCWHPDRLSRNLMEAGQVVDLLDQHIIKDLQFVTHTFENNPSGKMLLGISFVISKEFSDTLSVKVKRGHKNKFSEGRTQTPKHGYTNEDGYYRPQEKYFDICRKAWEMRLRSDSYETIADYLQKQKYGRIVKKTGQIVKLGLKDLTRFFRDSFYMGIIIQAHEEIDLRQKYDFVPMVSEEEFNKVQALSYRRQTPYNTHKRFTFYPFRGFVQCSYCGHNMVAGASSGHTRRYMYFRCEPRL
ncbi:recombinase family protein [Candidatus Beckwithbacteria bacterium]|nr:recombinase family protein [Candidatus Beckwithbacteria bacterium]